MSYDVGQRVRLPVTVKDVNGNLIDATMAVAVEKPDGTTYPAPAIVHDSTGLYHADVDVDDWGPWLWKFTASGTVVGVYTGQFFVRSPGAQMVGLQEAKKAMNKDLASTQDDDEVRDYIAAARWVIERIVGPVVPSTFVENHDGGKPWVHLRRGRILEVTSVVEVWGPGDIRTLTLEPDDLLVVTDDQYTVDVDGRRIGRRGSGYGGTFPRGSNNIRVTYRAGKVPMPDNYRLAALELISHLWRASQLAAGRVRPREDVLNEATSPGYAVPNRVRELIGHKRAVRLGG